MIIETTELLFRVLRFCFHVRVFGEKNTMTVRHLMTHTAGFGYGFLFDRPNDDPVHDKYHVTGHSQQKHTHIVFLSYLFVCLFVGLPEAWRRKFGATNFGFDRPLACS